MDFMPNVMMAVAGGSAWVFAYLIASQTSASGYGPEQCLGGDWIFDIFQKLSIPKRQILF